jgi:YidC/Oxa1 family membrane protein insertase
VTAPATAAAVSSPVECLVGQHRVIFDTLGAGVVQWQLEGDANINLLPDETSVARPLTAFPGLGFTALPRDHGVTFVAARADGLNVNQAYDLAPNGYLHTLTLTLENKSKTPVDASFSLGWGPGIASGDTDAKGRAAEQRALALENKRLHIFKDDTSTTAVYRWFAVDARYFLAAFPIADDASVTVRTAKSGKFHSAHRVETITLAPGEKKEIVQRFYLGPKSYDALASLGLGLERSVNFGFFATLARGIHQALLKFHAMTGNFGWAIIVLTFLVQVMLSPLTVSSFKHGQKMKALQPQMKRLREMYKSDPQRLNREMLALYQKHGLRFMGLEGCLPVLIQMPVFFSLYAVLSKTFELRHAPWIGWIHDLSFHDPFYILPVLMGVAMFFQQKIMMSSMDPSQKPLMYMMPIMFTFIFMKMPAGLVIYWLTQSLLTLTLQLVLLRRDAAKKQEVVL